jgi:hypothetical protein
MEEENALTRIIHEYRREAFETEACQGCAGEKSGNF